MAETIAGISDEQVAALVSGRWEDDDDDNIKPHWRRQVLVRDVDGVCRAKMTQWVFPNIEGWGAYFDDITFGGQRTHDDSLLVALKWCDDQAKGYEIERPKGTATNQADRFVELAANS